MVSDVFFSSLKTHKTESPLNKIERLLHKCQLRKRFDKNELIAIKTHFGELGNTAFVRPIFLRPIVRMLKEMGTRPFLTDTNTLYVGERTNSVDHLHNAFLNGFNYSTLQTPVIIADGLRGEMYTSVEINLEWIKEAKLASEIAQSDGMVCVSHFKGHEVSGFGGAIKNISMGCGSRAAKLEMHSATRPVIKQEECNACGICIENCGSNAIELAEKAVITDKCTGCARCIAVCPEKAVKIPWDTTTETVQKKMIEYAYATMKQLNSRIVFVNILTDISPACDCYGGNDEPIVGDIGFLASLDPIAIDKASFDLVATAMKTLDPFKTIYPHINSTIQFEHAKKIGFGSTEYSLTEIP